MSRERRAEVREQDLGGFAYLDRFQALCARLRDVGCARDKAGDRALHIDQFCLLVLWNLFNRTVASRRSIQQASELRKAQKKLGRARASLGTLSESSHVFEPQLLE